MENFDATSMLSIPKTSNKRKSYTLEDKILFIEMIAGGRKTQAEICNEFNVCHSTLGTILSNKEKILQSYQNNMSCTWRKRSRSSKHEDIEKLLINWYKEITLKGHVINGTVMRAKANEFATLLNKEKEFKANNGWFQRFKLRNNINLSSSSLPSSLVSGDQDLKSQRATQESTNLVYKNVHKNGSLTQLDEEDEENYTDDMNSNSDQNHEDNSGNDYYYDDDGDCGDNIFEESNYLQANSYEIPTRQEALNYLYKLRLFFETTEKDSQSALTSLDDLENELLNA